MRSRHLLAGLALLMALVSALALRDRPAGAAGPTPASAGPLASDADAVDRAIARADRGLTDLRQAASSGDPGLLREAEREILVPLLDALDACLVGQPPRVDPARYARVLAAVDRASGMFKNLAYGLSVRPGGGLAPIDLPLRRSVLPALAQRGRPSRWRVREVGAVVVLEPPG